MKGENKKKEKQKIPAKGSYNNLPLADLVLYALYNMEKKDIEKTFENLVVESYKLFPKKFSLPSYPQYPDANRVRREIQRMEGGSFASPGGEKLVKGTMKTDYRLTDRGLEKIKEIQKVLLNGKNDEVIERKIADKRGKMGRVLYEVEKHPLYQQYMIKGKNIIIPENLLRDLLFSTMETPIDKLKETMNALKEYCVTTDRNDLKEFLDFCCKKYDNIFSLDYTD